MNTKRSLLPMLAVVLAVVAAASALAAASAPPKRRAFPQPVQTTEAPQAPRRANPAVVRRLRGNVWRWQAVMGLRRSHSTARLRTIRALRYWRVQAHRVRRLAARPPHRRGWANRWTALEQMWVAERAHRSGRGYWPWPSTARFCGLL